MSGAGLNLLRGVTNYESELEKFVSDINHPSASISSVQRWLPVVEYDNKKFKFYLLFHMKVLSAHLSSIVIESENIILFVSLLMSKKSTKARLWKMEYSMAW